MLQVMETRSRSAVVHRLFVGKSGSRPVGTTAELALAGEGGWEGGEVD